jgi:alpha-tubulin suppressor-like RCC1 family protein
VTVSAIAVTGVTLDKHTLGMAMGGAAVGLAATIEPSDATNQAVSWSSSNTAVATVSANGGNGLAATVTAVSPGTATIIVSTQDGGKTAYCNVTVVQQFQAPRATLAAGDSHSLAIGADGSLWAWGSSELGRLGLGNVSWHLLESKSAPAKVGTDNDWTAVSAGGDFTLAIKADGSLWGWGDNWEGMLGLGDDATRSFYYVPTRVGTDNDWAAVSASYSYTLAIKTDGSLWAWGCNDSGRLGLGDAGEGTNRNVPTRVGAASNWAAVSTYGFHSLAIKTDGSLWAWGYNDSGRLGLGDFDDRYVPTRVGADNDWAAVSGGNYHSLAIKADGSLWAWGANESGRLGIGTILAPSVPTRVGADSNWAAVSAGGYHSLALKSNGSLWAWGENYRNELGLGDFDDRYVPTRVGADNNWAAVSAGGDHTLALKTDGGLWAWGANTSAQLGIGTNLARSVPTRVGTDNNWAAVSAYDGHTLAIKANGSLWAWGLNEDRLGLGDDADSYYSVPTRVGTDNWAVVSVGYPSTLAIKTDGSLWAWGAYYGATPDRVGADSDWVAVSSGGYYSMLAIKADGSLWAWGHNFYGALGLGEGISLHGIWDPTRVGTDSNWAAVQVGYYTTLAIKTDGSLWAWGGRYHNSDGSLVSDYFPVRVGTDAWAAISYSNTHALAIRADGGLWGGGAYGWDWVYDSPVGADKNWAAVSAGGAYYSSHSLAIKSNGSLWAWGINYHSQLGLGDGAPALDYKDDPTRVGADNNWTAVSAGDFHSLALKTDGSLWAWGDNRYGQLGDGTGMPYCSTPALVGTGWRVP